jgi:hypothetical protein
VLIFVIGLCHNTRWFAGRVGDLDLRADVSE